MTVGTVHLDSVLSGGHKRPEHLMHREVEETVSLKRSIALLETLKLRHREVSEKGDGSPGRLATNTIVDVADGEVHRPRLLVSAKYRELSFV